MTILEINPRITSIREAHEDQTALWLRAQRQLAELDALVERGLVTSQAINAAYRQLAQRTRDDNGTAAPRPAGSKIVPFAYPQQDTRRAG